ncbi:hypothetical protein V493_04480 [Pseudogymnoascus sp. VKM F-4281 (FW-2241)]|nr:hypothetical protein V493_04480 [Pseudogymnoascus sp. VKM F-4281 (FW-2241)]
MAAPLRQEPAGIGGVEAGGSGAEGTRSPSRISYVEADDVHVDDAREPSVKLQWGQVVQIDDSYLCASAFTKFWRSVLFQMILFGA